MSVEERERTAGSVGVAPARPDERSRPPLAPGAAPPAPRQRGAAASRRGRTILLAIVVVVIIVGGVVAYRYIRNQQLYVATDNAQVDGAIVQVGSINAGRVTSVSVDVGNSVQQGEQIASIELPSNVGVTSGGTPVLNFQGTQDQEAVVRSSLTGVVVERDANPGDTIAQGQAIIGVVDPQQLWVQALIDENQVHRVKLGDYVDVHSDDLALTLPGRVLAINRASAASFSPLPSTDTSGNFTKVTQLVPIKIAVQYGNLPLVLGSSVEITIHVQP
jgi:multidrug resistance efflux pump